MRTARFSSLIPDPTLLDRMALVVGTGAVGRQVAHMLANTGHRFIVLVDFDVVSIENCGTQGWAPGDVGLKKIVVLQRELADAGDPHLLLRGFDDRIEDCVDALLALKPKRPTLFMCVDDMDVRQAIVGSHLFTESAWPFLVDCRQSATVCSVRSLAASKPDHVSAWVAEWFPQSEAHPLPCTNRSTVFAAASCASLAVARHLTYHSGKDAIYPYLTTFDLLTGEGSSQWSPNPPSTSTASSTNAAHAGNPS